MQDIDKAISNAIERLHEDFDQVVRPLSPKEKTEAYKKLAKAFSDSLEGKRDYWSQVEFGEHVEGLYGIENSNRTFPKRER